MASVLPELRQVLAPYGVWALAMLGVIVLAGAALGSLRAWRVALGDNRVVRQRRVIAFAISTVGLGVTTALLSPVHLGLPGGAKVVVGFAAGSLVLAAIPVARPFACAIAMAEVLGAFAASVAVDLRVAHVWTPDYAVVAVGVAFAGTAAVTGWALGLELAKGVIRRAGMVAGSKATFSRASNVLRPFARHVRTWALAAAGLGVGAAVLVGFLGSSPHEDPTGPWLVVGALGVAPLTLLCGGILVWFWLVWWAAPVTEWCAGGVSLAAAIAGRVRPRMHRLLVWWRYPRALCDTCLRWSGRLDSTYQDGRRSCEKCGGEISFAGGPGKLVAVVGDQALPDRLPARVFLRTGSEVVAAADQIDVTHLRLDASDALAPELEHLVMFLSNEEPSHGLERVEVYAVRGQHALPATVSNLVSNHMTWTDVDPLAAATPQSRLARLWGRMAPEPEDAPDEWPLPAKLKRIAIGAAIGAVVLVAPRLLLSLLGMPFVFTTYEWGRQLTYRDATNAVVRPSLWELTAHFKFPLAAVFGAVVLLGAALLVGWRLWIGLSRRRHKRMGASPRPVSDGDASGNASHGLVRRGLSALAERGYVVRGVVLLLPLVCLAGVSVVIAFYLLPALWIALVSASFVVFLALDWLFSADILPDRAWIAWAICGAVLGAGLGFCSLAFAHSWRRREVLSIAAPVVLILLGAFVLPGRVIHAPPPMRSYIVERDQTAPVVSRLHEVTVRQGDMATFGLRVRDPVDKVVRLTIRVKNGSGKVLLKIRRTVSTGRRVQVRFLCRLSPGFYAYYVSARDAAGNSPTRASHAKLRVL